MYTVLIIEENKKISDALIGLINWEEHGFQILGIVSNGIVGRAIMERHKPDIILLSMSAMYLGGKGFIEAVESINYPFSIIQLYSKREALVNCGYSVNTGISINRNTLNTQELIRALEAASSNLMRRNEDNYDPMTQTLSAQRNNAILKLLQGITSEEYLKLKMRFRFSFTNEKLGIIIFYPFENRRFEEKLIKQLMNIVKAYLSYYHDGEVFITDSNHLGAIINFGKTKENYTQHLFFLFIAEKLCDAIKNQIGIDVDCVLADDANDILHLNKVYNAAQELEPYRYFKCETSVLTRRYITGNAIYVSLSEIDDCIQELDSAINNLNDQKLIREVAKLYLSLIKSSIDLSVVKYARERLANIYKSYIIEFRLDIDIENLGIMGEQCITVEQEYFKMKSVFSLLVEKANEIQENLHPVIRKSTNYINHNYAGEVTLQSVSEQANVSSVYLSRLFRQELNTTFVDYLTQIRIENAKRLMAFNNLKICDIARRVGYSDEKYFCRVFKKTTGKVPSEYRKTTRLKNR